MTLSGGIGITPSSANSSPAPSRQPTNMAKPGSFSLIAGTLTAGIIIAAGLLFFLTAL
jgi:predicted lipid-binding transport protein (Tim44 family)